MRFDRALRMPARQVFADTRDRAITKSSSTVTSTVTLAPALNDSMIGTVVPSSFASVPICPVNTSDQVTVTAAWMVPLRRNASASPGSRLST